MIEKLVVERRGEDAWNCLTRLVDEEGYKAAQGELRLLVCRRFWWLAGELFSIEGDLGWSPGFREFDTMLPPIDPKGAARLKEFILSLAQLPVSDQVLNLVRATQNERVMTLEARTMRFLTDRAEKGVRACVRYVYGRVATTKTEYELGAAREFLNMVEDKKRAVLGLAGLVLILSRGLRRRDVLAEKVKLIRFGRGDMDYVTMKEGGVCV